MKKVIRGVMGLLVLLSIAWGCFGIYTVTMSYDEMTSSEAMIEEGVTNQESYEAGAAMGSTIGLAFYACTGIPLFLFSLFVYWQMGRSIQRDKAETTAERRHKELMARR